MDVEKMYIIQTSQHHNTHTVHNEILSSQLWLVVQITVQCCAMQLSCVNVECFIVVLCDFDRPCDIVELFTSFSESFIFWATFSSSFIRLINISYRNRFLQGFWKLSTYFTHTHTLKRLGALLLNICMCMWEWVVRWGEVDVLYALAYTVCAYSTCPYSAHA